MESTEASSTFDIGDIAVNLKCATMFRNLERTYVFETHFLNYECSTTNFCKIQYKPAFP